MQSAPAIGVRRCRSRQAQDLVSIQKLANDFQQSDSFPTITDSGGSRLRSKQG